jgi:hypothetical protein
MPRWRIEMLEESLQCRCPKTSCPLGIAGTCLDYHLAHSMAGKTTSFLCRLVPESH